jgi:hypothetical protein
VALPLEGLRMIDMTRALSRPLSSIILADIVKIEPLPDGELDRGDVPHREATKTGAQTTWCRFKCEVLRIGRCRPIFVVDQECVVECSLASGAASLRGGVPLPCREILKTDCAANTFLPSTSRWPRMKMRLLVRCVSIPWATTNSLEVTAERNCESVWTVMHGFLPTAPHAIVLRA